MERVCLANKEIEETSLKRNARSYRDTMPPVYITVPEPNGVAVWIRPYDGAGNPIHSCQNPAWSGMGEGIVGGGHPYRVLVKYKNTLPEPKFFPPVNPAALAFGCLLCSVTSASRNGPISSSCFAPAKFVGATKEEQGAHPDLGNYSHDEAAKAW